MTTAGFIGLGSQGGGMAQRLIEMGVPTTLWARNPATVEPFGDVATIAADPAELGRRSDVVGICVTDGDAVRDVTLGRTGVLAGMAGGSVLAIHSTIGTDECDEIAAAAARFGVDVIDAPVSGGGAAAAAGTLTVYVGGSPSGVDRARPVLETYGDPVLHLGALGSGLRTKLINNVLNAANFALAHDAMAIGEALGLDVEQLGAALRNGSGRSFSLEVFVGLGSLDVIADHAGSLLAKDVDLFTREAAPSLGSSREFLLAPADRFLTLVGRPRTAETEAGTDGAR
jgi:3-hydroxyisobutyrate dehydrogenase-like beta-hydroxyacid dehydrogenase